MHPKLEALKAKAALLKRQTRAADTLELCEMIEQLAADCVPADAEREAKRKAMRAKVMAKYMRKYRARKAFS